MTLPTMVPTAGREDLLAWAGNFRTKPEKVFVAHGEESVSVGFAGLLRKRFGWNAGVPYPRRPINV